MANKTKTAALALGFLAVFVAGGWFFSTLPRWGTPQGEVETLYENDGEALGIFDNIPQQDMAAAEALARAGLATPVVLPEDAAQAAQQIDGRQLPSQLAVTARGEIAGVAPKENPVAGAEKEEKGGVRLDLTGNEVTAIPNQDISALPEGESKISMIAAPVAFKIIENTEQYKAFKRIARGQYPQADFKREMVVVLESTSNLPDKIFEIAGAEEKDGKLVVTYRVNVFGLDKKTNTHTAKAVKKTDKPVELKQVL